MRIKGGRVSLHCSHRHNMAFAPLLALLFSLAVVRQSDGIAQSSLIFNVPDPP